MSASAPATPAPAPPAPAKPAAPSAFKKAQPFLVGGAAGMFATTIIQPLDMVKVRIQLVEKAGASKSPFKIAGDLLKADGVRGFYKGLDSALLRQATYTTTRMGAFRSISNHLTEKNHGKPPSFLEKAIAGLAAGGIGAVVGTPADVALIRMQADGTLPVEQRRNYTGVVNALSRMVKEEGPLSLFKGMSPTVVRAMSLNMGMLATYDQSKQVLEAKYGANFFTMLGSSGIAGFFASFCSLPFDFVKTRIQKMKPDAQGVYPYKSSLDCAMKVLKSEGPLAFYSGFPTYYVRIAPHAMITLLAIDFMNSKIKALGL
eukprot:GILK01000150.1.p1 GENE.GILK01000150.1~~GILK01000150.1.p1  ORF type:complete len:316 (+),score=62.16 GILK01000150.1:38-985(+)